MKTSQVLSEGRTAVPGFFDTVEPAIPAPEAEMSAWPATAVTVSALQTSTLSMLTSPACPRPCQRFNCRLTATGA